MKCHVKECSRKTVEVVGECKFCKNRFCLKHRLVELHECPFMESCIQQAKNKNENILLRNKCTSIKITAI
jgi:predicted nucleic acid binding AN1-type Zn finger protein